MIKVTRAVYRVIKEFNEKEWYDENIIHYGKPVEYNERKFLFKATEDDKVVGSMSGKLESGVVYIDSIITGKESRGKGIGQALMKKAEEFAKNHGAHKIWLITGNDWEANAFYEKLGFEKVGKLPRHHFERDFVIYSKFI